MYPVWQPPLFHLIMTLQAAEILTDKSQDAYKIETLVSNTCFALGKFQSLSIWCTLRFGFSTDRSSILFRFRAWSFMLESHVIYNSLSCQFWTVCQTWNCTVYKDSNKQKINIGIIKDKAVNQKYSFIVLTPPHNTDLLCQLLWIEAESAKSWLTGHCEM